MNIRLEKEGDEAAIGRLTNRAFSQTPHASGQEAAIIEQLRVDGDLALSLVAAEDDQIIGHVAFSPVRIGTKENGWFGLGPLSVDPDRQGCGIGSQLALDGLKTLRDRQARGCVVLGDPAYYARFGFRSDGKLTYGEVPPAFLQWISFGDESPIGEISYRPGFDV
ncbi:GNAT family N-acetyltransferase [Notoacmeibacter sp. MSK16QG-6]|uniref:GNAT family N-acetyltransferase n=1 Tax=Notoacmeibacter sp. MSK16QG-6 TaxID=2957982 RepID=UPI00209CC8F4|nr:N-acetyltransferase [Notoacmeibacter sp. MSK16QG-6]MCP1200969.1 N-acetyltransferase [Notoacmeibacter sp. MSK16QG-6]